MIDSLYIAWKYVVFNKMRTATLVACITLISFLISTALIQPFPSTKMALIK